MQMSFMKDMSSISRKNLTGAHSTMLDSTILRDMKGNPSTSTLNIGERIVEEDDFASRKLVNKQNYLTPLDFIQLVRTDPEMKDEFCYMVKRDNPYDWEIVDYTQKEKYVKKSIQSGKALIEEVGPESDH